MTLTRSIVKLSTIFARPKSATLTLGGLSFVKRIFYETQWVYWPISRSSQGTSGLRSRWVMPCAWIYYISFSTVIVDQKDISHRKGVTHLVSYMLCIGLRFVSNLLRFKYNERHYSRRPLWKTIYSRRSPPSTYSRTRSIIAINRTSTGKIAWLTYITVILKENFL